MFGVKQEPCERRVLSTCEPFGALPPQHRAIGYLPQGYELFPDLRAWENVAFSLSRGPPRRAHALELLARIKLVQVWPLSF